MGRARPGAEHADAGRPPVMGGRQGEARVTAARTIEAMEDRLARRDLALAAVTVVGLSRLIEPPGVWLVAVFLLGAMLLGTLQVLGDVVATDGGVPIESLILPAVAVSGFIVVRALALEARIISTPEGLGPEDRTAVLVATLTIAFLGFVGVAATVPGGLAQPGATGAAGGPLPIRDLAVLAAADALVAFLLGYRAAALRLST